MKGFLSLFSNSFKEFKSIRTLTTVSMLIALYVVLKLFTINFGGVVKISFTFIAIATIGCLFGPAVAMLAAPICDLLGYLSRPDGESYLPLFGVVILCQGLIYGIFLYKAPQKQFIPRIIIAKTLSSLIGNVVLNTAILYIYYGESMITKAVIGTRIVKNLCLLPIEIIILTTALFAIRAIYSKIGNKKLA
ncbi:MAG: folate family ECF transporter S component [Oscillospiraceae bacterium]